MKRIRLTHVGGSTVEREFVHCDKCDRELGLYEVGKAPLAPHLCNPDHCKMKPETPATIAGLWHEADGLIRLSIPQLEKLTHPNYKGNEDMRPIFQEQLVWSMDKLQAIRQQLVERCKNDHGLSIEDGGDLLRIIRDRIHFVTVCGADHARNEGSAWLFMDWELQQRQREKEAAGE